MGSVEFAIAHFAVDVRVSWNPLAGGLFWELFEFHAFQACAS